MLVHHIEPMGYTSVDGKRVYGEYFSYGRFGPTEVTYEQFKRYRPLLREIPITDKWLSDKFNKQFPQCSFKYTEMRKLDFDKMVEIAILLGIDYRKPRYPDKKDVRALKNAVIRKIDSVSK